MLINKNKLLIALKLIRTPSFFKRRSKISIYHEKTVNEWALLIWKFIIKDLGYDEDTKKINRDDFNKLVLYYLNDSETNKLFYNICNGLNYFTYELFLEFLLSINDEDYSKLINSFEKK